MECSCTATPFLVYELNDGLNVVRFSLQGLRKVLWLLAPRDKARQPRSIRAGQRFTGLVPVPFVSVDAADHDVVLEHRRSRNVSRGAPTGKAAAPNPVRHTMPPGPDRVDRIRYDLSDAGAFNEDVRFEADATDGAGVVGRGEGGDKLRVRA